MLQSQDTGEESDVGETTTFYAKNKKAKSTFAKGAQQRKQGMCFEF